MEARNGEARPEEGVWKRGEVKARRLILGLLLLQEKKEVAGFLAKALG